jgi:hypothetical protein
MPHPRSRIREFFYYRYCFPSVLCPLFSKQITIFSM